MTLEGRGGGEEEGKNFSGGEVEKIPKVSEPGNTRGIRSSMIILQRIDISCLLEFLMYYIHNFVIIVY